MTDTAPAPARRIEYVPLDELAPATRNPKRHRDELLRGSISRFGFAAPALRDERTGRLVVGHGRTQALGALRDAGQSPPDGVRVAPDGRWLVPVVCGWSSRSDAEAEAYLVADNRHTELGGWDSPALADMLTDIAGTDEELLAMTGFSEEELANMVGSPVDLDKIADEVGDPSAADTWPVVRVRVPPHLAAAWREHLSTHGDDEVQAFAALLELDAEAPEVTWKP